MNNITVGKQTQGKWSSLRNVKARASVLMFLQRNNITDMAELVSRIETINNDFKSVTDEIRKVDRRLDTLALHFHHHENYKKHKDMYAKYKKLDPKKAEAFYDKHYEAIQEYEAARTHLNGVMGENKTLSIKTWEKEQKSLTARKFVLCERYYTLQDDVRSIELLRRGVDSIVQEDRQQERQATRTQNAEL
jgi:hypothetical protein